MNTQFNFSRVFLLLLMSIFWLPFIYSADSYSGVDWYFYLKSSRTVMFILPLIFILILFISKKNKFKFEQNYYLLAMFFQATHAILEPSDKLDFYSFISLFLLFFALVYKSDFHKLLKYYLPMIIFFHLFPLSFKDNLTGLSFSAIIDKFSFNVSLIFLSIINIWILISKNKYEHLYKIEKESRLKFFENEILKLRDELSRNISSTAQLHLSRQIAHDIRSPLEALKSVVSNLGNLDYSTKQIIVNSVGRISDIANGLLKTGKESAKGQGPVCLRLLIEDVISDKKFEHSLHISFHKFPAYRESFVLGNENELYRAISNIINNAIEAQTTNPKVLIELTLTSSKLILSIKDHGKGMSNELIQKVLAGGISTKESGNGLGVNSSKQTFEAHQGTLTIESVEGEGTTVEITIPQIIAPNWFVDELVILDKSQGVICIDDDPSFLELYKEKLKSIKPKVVAITEKGINQLRTHDKMQFFFDYDLGSVKTGLDYIETLGIASQTVLVTSMFQDEKIQEQCNQLGVKILPKQIFNNAKVVQLEKNMKQIDPHKQHILIDDDELMHMSWKMAAEEAGIALDSYFSISDFLKHADHYAKDSSIYIDSNLGENIKGEVESEKIFMAGFTNLFLATGYSASDIQKPNWIKEVIGKRAEFK